MLDSQLIEANSALLEQNSDPVGEGLDGGASEVLLTRDQFAKGFAWTSAFGFIAKVVFPLAGLYINRKLGPTILGLASILQMTVQLSEVVREAGLTQTLINEKEITQDLLRTYSALKWVTSLIPAILVVALTPLFVAFFRQPELGWSMPWVSVCLLMNGFGAVPTAQLLRRGEFRRIGLIGVIAGSTAIVAAVFLVACGVGFPSLVVQMLVVCATNLFFTLRAQPPCMPKFDWALMSKIAKKSRALLGANVLNNIFLLTDIFVITKMVGTTASGLYNTAQNIAYKPLDLILFPLGRTLMVAFGQSKDPDRLAAVYWRSIKAIALLLIPVYVFMACNSSGLVELLLGQRFLGAIPVLNVLSLYLACRTVGSISGNALVPIGRHAWTLYPWALALAVTTVGLCLISKHPSLMGIVWSFTAGAMSVYLSIFGLAASWLPPSRAQVLELGKACLVLAASSSLMVGLQVWPISPVIRLAATVPLVGMFHLLAAGIVFERSPSAFLSPRGIRSLYRSL